MENRSIKNRFAVSTLGNLIKGALTFMATLFIARGLGPEHYGSYIFLLSGFTAMRAILDMGTGAAFHTFISQKPRSSTFYIIYAIWQFFQFIFPLVIIAFFFPQEWLEIIWVGHERSLILLAFATIFFQQMAWPTMIHIGESKRLTQRVQALNISISAVNLILVVGAYALEILTIPLLFWILVIQYILALGFAFKVLSVFKVKKEPLNIKSMLREYLSYCLPLIIGSWLGFASEFADRWLLQKFGGAEEQAFFMVGLRFATIVLLATTSMLNIFWKEIAEAQENKNLVRLRELYRKVSRFLYTVSAVIAGFLVPWSPTIATLMLGSSYAAASSVLPLMLIFSVHASLGQVNGTFLLSSGKTKTIVIMESIFLVISIPVSYLIQAPYDALIPGFNLGSVGMAWKAILLNITWVNCVSWWVAKNNGWKFDWAYQVVGLTGALAIGWISYELVMKMSSILTLNIFLQGTVTFAIYGILIGVFIWFLPWLTGFSQREVQMMFSKIIHLIFSKKAKL
ncbi:lipopolysaccharide biosynthesis protein [Nitrospinae bacterium]|nr:lipopolysaccharide biosynthesis protein [Nitrospinota bacterium]